MHEQEIKQARSLAELTQASFPIVTINLQNISLLIMVPNGNFSYTPIAHTALTKRRKRKESPSFSSFLFEVKSLTESNNLGYFVIAAPPRTSLNPPQAGRWQFSSPTTTTGHLEVRNPSGTNKGTTPQMWSFQSRLHPEKHSQQSFISNEKKLFYGPGEN